jgi:hypothetical protein
LPADQLKLLQKAKATGKPLIVVNMSGSAINHEWAKQNANAIIQAWYPGESGGLAVGRTIAGLANPAGRLPKIALRGFQRVSLLPGQSRRLRFVLSPRDVGSVSPDGKAHVLAGHYQAFVGGGQPASGLPGKWGAFSVRATVNLPD